MGEATPAAAEVAGAVSPAVDGATPAQVEGAPAVNLASDDAADRATAAKRRE
jgi:hypothetical protein